MSQRPLKLRPVTAVPSPQTLLSACASKIAEPVTKDFLRRHSHEGTYGKGYDQWTSPDERFVLATLLLIGEDGLKKVGFRSMTKFSDLPGEGLPLNSRRVTELIARGEQEIQVWKTVDRDYWGSSAWTSKYDKTERIHMMATVSLQYYGVCVEVRLVKSDGSLAEPIAALVPYTGP